MKKTMPYQTSFWFENLVDDQNIQIVNGQNLSFDVVVVGGGFAGLSTAFFLRNLNPNISVAIVEAEHVGFGASGRSAGWLDSFPPLFWLLENLNDSRRVEELSFVSKKGKAIVSEISSSLGLCQNSQDWMNSQHQLYSRNTLERSVLIWIKNQLDLLNFPSQLSIYDPSDNLVGYPTNGRLSWDCFAINPYQIILKLKRKCFDLGVNIFEKSKVNQIELSKTFDHSSQHKILFKNGAIVKTNKLVLASNAQTRFIQGLGKDSNSGFVQKSYMIATEKIPHDVQKRISNNLMPFGDPTMSYFCGRFYEGRFLFNGKDQRSFGSFVVENEEKVFHQLTNEMYRRFPFLADFKLSSAWAGEILHTNSDSPILKASILNPNLFFNFGFGAGSGIHMALQSGRLMSKLIAGNSDKDSEVQRTIEILQSCRFPALGPLRAISGVVKGLFSTHSYKTL